MKKRIALAISLIAITSTASAQLTLVPVYEDATQSCVKQFPANNAQHRYIVSFFSVLPIYSLIGSMRFQPQDGSLEIATDPPGYSLSCTAAGVESGTYSCGLEGHDGDGPKAVVCYVQNAAFVDQCALTVGVSGHNVGSSTASIDFFGQNQTTILGGSFSASIVRVDVDDYLFAAGFDGELPPTANECLNP
ncbi:MAG: hypothetical protein LC098_04060 [Burkholderiales bacterium]|nr:hypothetical protein [Burkholderiales bacterium]